MTPTSPFHLHPQQNHTELEIQTLATLKRPALIELWIEHFGNAPPKFASTKLLVRAVAYGIQVKRYGGLAPKLQKELLRLAALSKDQIDKKSRRTLSPGTRLIRDWHGRTFTVDVTEAGFAWDGRIYKSLSHIARQITNTARNGPHFFGLK